MGWRERCPTPSPLQLLAGEGADPPLLPTATLEKVVLHLIWVALQSTAHPVYRDAGEPGPKNMGMPEVGGRAGPEVVRMGKLFLPLASCKSQEE